MKDGLAIYTDGSKIWFMKNLIHREDGPAVEYTDGQKEWWINNKRHRLDGPAIIFPSGRKMWFFNGKPIPCRSQEGFDRLLKLKVFW